LAPLGQQRVDQGLAELLELPTLFHGRPDGVRLVAVADVLEQLPEPSQLA
jgi:hypothetical protein